jgi:hypothetical protein
MNEATNLDCSNELTMCSVLIDYVLSFHHMWRRLPILLPYSNSLMQQLDFFPQHGNVLGGRVFLTSPPTLARLLKQSATCERTYLWSGACIPACRLYLFWGLPVRCPLTNFDNAIVPLVELHDEVRLHSFLLMLTKDSESLI